MSKLVVEKEWFIAVHRSACLRAGFEQNPDQLEGFMEKHPEKCRPLTPAQERLLDGTTAELVGKAERNGIRIALEAIGKLQRWCLVWEWMEEADDGEYIKVSEAKSALIDILADIQKAKGGVPE